MTEIKYKSDGNRFVLTNDGKAVVDTCTGEVAPDMESIVRMLNNMAIENITFKAVTDNAFKIVDSLLRDMNKAVEVLHVDSSSELVKLCKYYYEAGLRKN